MRECEALEREKGKVQGKPMPFPAAKLTGIMWKTI